jgi:hypothetical protein
MMRREFVVNACTSWVTPLTNRRATPALRDGVLPPTPRRSTSARRSTAGAPRRRSTSSQARRERPRPSAVDVGLAAARPIRRSGLARRSVS